MSKCVVDSSVILTLINNEPYTINDLDEIVRKNSLICSVTYVEILSKLIEKKISNRDSLEHLLKSVYCKHIYQSNDNINSIAAELSIYKKSHNLSLGDKYCLALAKTFELPVYTADKAWKSLENIIDVNIILIR